MNTWIQFKGEDQSFKEEISEEADVDDLRKAIFQSDLTPLKDSIELTLLFMPTKKYIKEVFTVEKIAYQREKMLKLVIMVQSKLKLSL